MEKKEISTWKVVATHSVVVREVKANDEGSWHVDRRPPIETKTAKVAYGSIKVVTRHGKK